MPHRISAAEHEDAPEAYFTRTSGSTYRATSHTGGGWSTSEQHISPLIGLIVHTMEQRAAGTGAASDGKVLSRLSFDILGTVPIDEVEIEVSTVRSGRTIELLEAVVRCRDRETLRAHAWRLATSETASVSGGDVREIPRAEELPRWPMSDVWPGGGYIASINVQGGR